MSSRASEGWARGVVTRLSQDKTTFFAAFDGDDGDEWPEAVTENSTIILWRPATGEDEDDTHDTSTFDTTMDQTLSTLYYGDGR